MVEFSQKIKYIRKHHTLTQEQLAKKLNVSRKTISAWENNRGIPDYQLVKHIEEIFCISTDCLLDDSQPLFMDSRELKNKFKDKIKWALYIEIIFIFFGYLTLFKIYNNTINTIILIMTTVYLNKNIRTYYPKSKSYHVIMKSVVFLAHLLVGIQALSNYITQYALDESIHYVCGLGIALVIVSYVVTYALLTTLRLITIINKDK
ncbi:helix-turn-helix domain-containing protein [Holzapfeliella sp. JNUCC 80]